MESAMELYEKLTAAPDEPTRARIIVEAFERLEGRLLAPSNLATASQLSETELRLQKEIEQIRSDMHAMDGRLIKEIEQIRSDMHAMDGRLTKEIEQIRAGLKTEIEQVRAELKTEIEQLRAELKTDIAQAKTHTIQWTAGLLVVQLGLFGTLVKLLVG